MQSIKIMTNQTYLEKKKVEPVESVLKKIYQINTYRKDFSWPHFVDESRGTSPDVIYNSIPYVDVWQIYSYTKQPQEKETSQNELKLKFSWRQFQQQRSCKNPNPIQKRRSTPASYKMICKNRPIHFHINKNHFYQTGQTKPAETKEINKAAIASQQARYQRAKAAGQQEKETVLNQKQIVKQIGEEQIRRKAERSQLGT